MPQLNDPAERLIKAMKETAGSRFIAAQRLEEHDKRLTRLTAFTSAYIIALTILPYFEKMPAHVTDLYNLITVAFSVVILVASLLQYSSGDVVNAEQHHRSALEINELRRLLLAEFNLAPQTIIDFTNKYNAVLQKYSINHDELDYSKYQVDRPEEHTWMKWPRKCQIHFQLAVEKYTPDTFLIFITCVFVALVYHGATIAAIN